MAKRYQCDNCSYSTNDEDDLTPLHECCDLIERLDFGSIVPAGDCPKCRCFVYDTKPEYQSQRDMVHATELRELLEKAVLFVEDSVNKPQYKKSEVTKLVKKIHKLLDKTKGKE